MESLINIEGNFKAKCSYLVCKYSTTEPSLVTKSSYAALSSKFEADLQKEINFLLTSCEDDKGVDLIDFLNRLLKISDQARNLFIEINNPQIKHIIKSANNTTQRLSA